MQLKIIIFGIVCIMISAFLIELSIFDTKGLTITPLSQYSFVIVSLIIAFIGIMGVVLSLILGFGYAVALEYKFDLQINPEKYYTSYDVNKVNGIDDLFKQIRNQGYVFFFFMLYAVFVLFFIYIYPILDKL